MTRDNVHRLRPRVHVGNIDDWGNPWLSLERSFVQSELIRFRQGKGTFKQLAILAHVTAATLSRFAGSRSSYTHHTTIEGIIDALDLHTEIAELRLRYVRERNKRR